MAVNWVQNPLLGRQTPFYQPEEQYDTSGSSWMGGVGADTQTPPQVDSIFAPAQPGAAVAGGAALLGGDTGGTPPAAEQMDYPSADAIERRRKLAEALMGKQMEVNHPMQAIANAVSQITGAYINNKADQDQKAYEKHRRDVYQQSFDAAGGDLDKLMAAWMKSGDPDLVDKAYDYQLKKMVASQQGTDAPETRNFYEGSQIVTKQWDPRSRQWVSTGPGSPRWKGSSGGGGVGFDPTDDADQIGGGGYTGNGFAGGAGLIDPNAESQPTINGYKQAIGPDGKPKFDANYRPIVIGKDGKEYSMRFPSAAKYARAKGALNDDDVTARAMMYLSGDAAGAFQGVSRANGGIQSRQIGERRTELARAMGMNSREAGLQTSEARGSYQAMMTKRRTAARMVANSVAFISAAKGFGDVLKQRSKAWPRGQFVPMNQMRNFVAKNIISNADYTAFMAAMNSFVQAYAKAVSPQGAPTEGMRQHAYDILSSSMSQEAFDKNMQTLYDEMTNEASRLRALDNVFGNDWIEKYGGSTGGEDSEDAIGGDYMDSGEKPASAASRPAPPKPGQVIRGWRFKGGDPRDRKNYEKVQ